jgi:hypothetical protein
LKLIITRYKTAEQRICSLTSAIFKEIGKDYIGGGSGLLGIDIAAFAWKD